MLKIFVSCNKPLKLFWNNFSDWNHCETERFCATSAFIVDYLPWFCSACAYTTL